MTVNQAFRTASIREQDKMHSQLTFIKFTENVVQHEVSHSFFFAACYYLNRVVLT